MRVTVTTLGRFHAFDLAAQLHRHGVLRKLITVYPKNYVQKWGIPPEKVISLLPLGAFFRLVNHVPRVLKSPMNVLCLALYDWIAAWLLPWDSDIVIGWSGCCTRILRRARKNRAITIVERGSAHILTQLELLKRVSPMAEAGTPKWVIRHELTEYREAAYIMLPSEFAVNSFLAQGIPEEKLLKNPYGVDLSSFQRQPKSDNVFRVIHCGAITLQKGVHILLQAFCELDLPDAELWLIGSVAPEMEPYLNRFCHPGIIKKGTFPQSELYRYYAQGSVFCLCSIQDGFGMVLIQAMACGLPAIATVHSGGPDIISDGQEGFLVPVGNVTAVKEKLKWLHEHPAEREKMGVAAEAKARRGFSWDDYGDRAVQLYETVLAGAER